jgi:hypothetical protein
MGRKSRMKKERKKVNKNHDKLKKPKRGDMPKEVIFSEALSESITASRSLNLLRSWGLYRTVFRCQLCGLEFASPIVEQTLERIFDINTRVICPGCTASAHHENPSLRVPIVIHKIEDIHNEFALITQF